VVHGNWNSSVVHGQDSIGSIAATPGGNHARIANRSCREGDEMQSVRTIVARVTLTAVFATASFLCAAVAATDLTDLWWNPGESGWGMNIAHQSNVLFLTFFLYGADGKAGWFTATADYAGQNAGGSLLYTGDLYQTTGPYYGGGFSPAQVHGTKVGTATFQADTVDTGQITYLVNGVQVVKAVQRQLLRYNNLSGSYLGGILEVDYNCISPVNNGSSAHAATLTVQHTGQQVTIFALYDTGGSCTYHATYDQAGRMGSLRNGTASCSNGLSGTFTAYEIESSLAAMTGRFEGQGNGCQFFGTLGGLRR